MVGRGRAQQVGLGLDDWLRVFFDFEWGEGRTVSDYFLPTAYGGFSSGVDYSRAWGGVEAQYPSRGQVDHHWEEGPRSDLSCFRKIASSLYSASKHARP